MIVLGVETSGPVGSVALRREGRCVEERFLPELGRRHAQSLVPEVVAFLRRHGVAPGDIDVVAVSVGPGSFTGLRVGVTFAKSFAYAAGAELIGVETFRAIAENTPAAGTIAAIADAQRGGLMFGEYERDLAGRLVRRSDVRLIAPNELPNLVTPSVLLSGPGMDRIDVKDASACEVAAPHAWSPRASVVARLGEVDARCGVTGEPWTLEPLYVRKSSAEEKREAAERERS